MSAWRWVGRVFAVGFVYLGWGVGFALLEDGWLAGGGGLSFGVALVVPLAAGAAAWLLAGPGRFLPLATLVVVGLDTVVAAILGGIPEPLGRDLLLRAVPLVAVLGSLLLTSLLFGRRALPADQA